jgi:hypothetical protein
LIKFCAGDGFRRLVRGLCALAGSEKIAKIRPFLVDDTLGLRFAALIVVCSIVELTIEAGMQCPVASGAIVAEADPFFDLDFSCAFPALHDCAFPSLRKSLVFQILARVRTFALLVPLIA